MGKVLLMLLVVGVVAAWWMLGRRGERAAGGNRAAPAPKARRGRSAKAGAPATMIACSHCGVHLPQPEALFDAAGRPYCSEAHRLAGPR
jgi:uncharacterized protein